MLPIQLKRIMEKSKVYLFTSPTCPHCAGAKKFIHEFKKERDDFALYDLSTATHEGSRKAKVFGIMSVPTFIIKGPNHPEFIGLRGVQSKKTMNKCLDLSYGIEPKKRKSFKEKLKEKFKLN